MSESRVSSSLGPHKTLQIFIKKMQEIPIYKEFNILEYKVEFLITILFGIVLVYHWIGKGNNRKIAKTFQEKLGKLENEFCVFGDGFGHKIICNGPDEYYFYGTGRENITKMLATIKTCSRHDVLSIGKQQKDTVTFEFTLKTTNSHIFALFLKRNSLKKLKRWDLEKMTSVLTFPGLRKDVYTIVGDNSQVFSTLLDDMEIRRDLYEFAGLNSSGEGETKNYLLEEIICSDSIAIKPERSDDLKQEMKISFTLKISMDQDEIDKMIYFVLKVVDSVSAMGPLSKEVLFYL